MAEVLHFQRHTPRRREPLVIVQAELDDALDVLDSLHRGAQANLKAAGRDPSGASVLLRDWSEAMRARHCRFSPVLAELERRGVVAVDGPFARLRA